MKSRTLLVDANNILKRSFHGAKDLYTNKFGHIGGLYQFMTSIRKQIKDNGINKVVLAWDGENGGIFRHRIDRDYKANRKNKEWYRKIEMSQSEIKREIEKDESILKQRKRVQAYAEELFIRQIEVDEIEGDDLIAAYCLQYHEDEDIYLYSNDRDFAQLLDLNLTIIFPNIVQQVTKANYMMHFDHHYSNALVLKIITGDTADNIKGIEGLGEKTLLENFPELKFKHVSVREICNKANEINTSRVLQKKKPLKSLVNLLNNVGRLKTNFALTNLRQPILNEQAVEELRQLGAPLSPDGRSSKNLYKMMIEDEFLTVYNSTFVNYIEPYYTVIMGEKQLLNEYYNKK